MNKLNISTPRIWDNALPVEDNSHRVVLFRQHFRLEKSISGAELYIAADTDFIVCLDGKEINRGQFSDDPTVKTFNTMILPELSAGDHLLAVQVYFCGVDTSGYSPGKPGLYCSVICNGNDILHPEKWLTASDPAFQSSCRYIVTRPLGITTCYDLQQQINWADVDFDDLLWQPAKVFTGETDRVFQLRPAHTHSQIQKFHPAKPVKCGNFQRPSDMPDVSAARLISQDICYSSEVVPESLPETFQTAYGYSASGIWLIADLGREMVGFVEFELDAPAGARVDYAHGEHLADGRVRAEIYGRNFADTCICREGRNVFQLPFRRIGGRYLELHISELNGKPLTLHRIGIRPWVLPLPPAAECNVSEETWQTLQRRAVKTLELCMHEHYEDCPWREQALYSYDSRWQMLYGYYLWGNGDFAAASLNLFAPGQREDGHLRLCAPSRSKTVIPIYSLIWIVQLYEHYLYTGSNELFINNRTAAQKLIKARLADYDAATELYHPGSFDFWQFYEWAEGLNSRGIQAGELHALYNLYFIEALDAYSKLLKSNNDANYQDYQNIADELRKNVEQVFYNSKRGLYASTYYNGKQGELFHEHTQVMMLYTQSVPQDRRALLWQKINDRSDLIPMTLSSLPYRVLAAMDAPDCAVENLEQLLLDAYKPMLKSDTDTLWETSEGQRAFQFAGSLCHGWSALPTYYLSAVVLGVKPVEPGFRKFSVTPHWGSFKEVSGAIVTPAGKIYVDIRQTADGVNVKIKHPQSLVLEANAETWQKAAKVTVETY